MWATWHMMVCDDLAAKEHVWPEHNQPFNPGFAFLARRPGKNAPFAAHNCTLTSSIAHQQLEYCRLPASEPPFEPTAEALACWGRHY